MTYDFFANKIDKIVFLNFIFKETNLRIFDHYSPYSQEISEYKSTVEIESKFDLERGSQFAATFELWSPLFNGKYFFRRINLDPRRCSGHTFRYSTDGWGLIQLYFGGLENNILSYSHIGHQSEKRASAWESLHPEMGKVSDWNWKEVESISRKLKYQLHNKMAIRKIDSYGILPGADELEKQGIKLQ